MDSADFEQLLWQPTVEDSDAGLDDSVLKSEKELDISLEKGVYYWNQLDVDSVFISCSALKKAAFKLSPVVLSTF
jgi:hypothetical protein